MSLFTSFFAEIPFMRMDLFGNILLKIAKCSFPVGKVDMKTLYPMDMEEFMLALGEDDLVEQK